MIRKHVARVAAVASVVGMTVAAPIAIPGAVTAAFATTVTICGYLDDGGGAGSASSLPPGATPTAGMHFEQENAGAWQLCFDSGDGEITLYAYQETWCMADDSGYAELRSCNGNYDQSWYGPTVSGSFKVHNINGGVLCADGGVTYIDLVVSSSSCSSYHQSWAFETSP